jgi:hypothetical protein
MATYILLKALFGLKALGVFAFARRQIKAVSE